MDSQASSDDEKQVDRSSRSSSGAEEDGAVTSLKKRLAEAEEQLTQLQIENAGHKAQINRLQKDRVRRSILHQPTPLAVIEEAPKEPEAVDKMEQFFKIFNTKNISSAQLSIHAINSLVSLHQILYAKEDSSSGSIAPFSNDKQKPNSERAAKIAFNYVLEFTRQLNLSKMDSEANVVDLSYPISWLLSLFPYNANEESNKGKEGSSLTDLLWMPLHFSLALDSTYSTLFENSTYLEDIRLLLEEFGPAAFEEDVSPLSVAVSIAKPNLEAVKLIVAYRPDCVSKTDEDGSLPLMHACANNLSLDVIEYLIELYPAAIQATDSFGCAAIHYAAFYGCANTVKYLISVEPKCAHMVEGNGALPIHDAVQNQRSFGAGCTEMVEFLLQVYPDSVRKRDDYGAFPLHKAAKSSELAVVKLLHAAFPKVKSFIVVFIIAVCTDRTKGGALLLSYIVADNIYQ